jgi:hypothetical protein
MRSLDVPTWVPPAVAHQARLLHRQAVEAEAPWLQSREAIPLIERLVTDSQMQNVWGVLKRRKRENYRRTGKPFHPATLPRFAHDPGQAVARQAVAAGLLFHFAVFFRLAPVRAIPARLLSANPRVDEDDPIVVERERGNLDVRGYAVCLAEQCRELFGGPHTGAMYRTVARIASVAFDRTIAATAVREWCDRQSDRALRLHAAYPQHAKAKRTRVRRRP